MLCAGSGQPEPKSNTLASTSPSHHCKSSYLNTSTINCMKYFVSHYCRKYTTLPIQTPFFVSFYLIPIALAASSIEPALWNYLPGQ